MYMYLWLYDNANYHCNFINNKIVFQHLWTKCLWLMKEWCRRGQKRKVMTMAGGGSGGVFGVSKRKGKTQPTGNQSIMTASCSPFFWVHWKVATDWKWTPKEGLECQHTCMYIKMNRKSCPFQNCLSSTDRGGFSLLLHHLSPWQHERLRDW